MAVETNQATSGLPEQIAQIESQLDNLQTKWVPGGDNADLLKQQERLKSQRDALAKALRTAEQVGQKTSPGKYEEGKTARVFTDQAEKIEAEAYQPGTPTPTQSGKVARQVINRTAQQAGRKP